MFLRIIGIHPSIRQLIGAALSGVAVLLVACSVIHFRIEAKPAYVQYRSCPQIILDAGHGGMDGGAVGVDGVVEKGINLSITLKLKELLQINGFEVILTRETDASIHDPNETTIAGQKRSDMYNRMEIIKDHPTALFLSIHQNMFSDSSCHGAQIFFSPNHESSERLAQKIQNTFQQRLQFDNTREVKEAGDNLFLLYHANIPAVLVECGFLSNPEECTLLSEEAYQRKIAYILYLSLLDFYSEA